MFLLCADETWLVSVDPDRWMVRVPVNPAPRGRADLPASSGMSRGKVPRSVGIQSGLYQEPRLRSTDQTFGGVSPRLQHGDVILLYP